MSNPRMVSESGIARLSPNLEDVTSDSYVGIDQLMLDNQSAQYAVEALGKGNRLVILDANGDEMGEFELVDVRLRAVPKLPHCPSCSWVDDEVAAAGTLSRAALVEAANEAISLNEADYPNADVREGVIEPKATLCFVCMTLDGSSRPADHKDLHGAQ